MGSETIVRMFDTELDAFAELARELTADQWQRASLCTEWTTRQVIEHVAFHTHRAGLRQVLGNGDKWSARLAAEANADTIDGLVAWLGTPAADSARRSVINICELVIHQQDVRRPLDTPRTYPESTMRTCLDHCTSVTGNLFVIGAPRRRGRNLRLVTTDLDWSKGRGPAVEGPAESVLMAIAGRPAALTSLSGDGVPLLAERIELADPLPSSTQ